MHRLLVGLLVCGCAEPDDAIRSEGCGGGAPAEGVHTIAVEGNMRTYLLGLPSGYDADTAYPIVFAFHGAGSSAEEFASPGYGNLAASAGRDAILVHGQALPVEGRTQWVNTVDIPYFDAVREEVTRAACVDVSRVFALGHSSGGFFTNRLGCERGRVLRAIAPLSAGGPALATDDPACIGEVAAWVDHGSADDVVDISEGEASRDYWGSANGCDLSSPESTSPAGCVAYPGCDPGFPVHWCVTQRGHELDRTTTAGAWSFFADL